MDIRANVDKQVYTVLSGGERSTGRSSSAYIHLAYVQVQVGMVPALQSPAHFSRQSPAVPVMRAVTISRYARKLKLLT